MIIKHEQLNVQFSCSIPCIGMKKPKKKKKSLKPVSAKLTVLVNVYFN